MNNITYSKLRAFTISLLFLFCFIFDGNAQTVTMPNIFGSNMVLQQNTQVPLWGWATAGTSVLVTASWGQPVTVITGTNGKWMTKIQTPIAVPGQAPVYTLSIKGPMNTITFTNILVGEVWLCSGQSNMWFPLNMGDYKVVDYANEVAAAKYPNIRLFIVPQSDAVAPAVNCGGSWASCTPTTATPFSAIGYFFGRELYNNKALNVPIGMISNAYPGSGIQAWVKDSVLQANADLKSKYIDLNANTIVYKKPSLLYNAMIAPLIPFAMKGILWYQGESNTSDDGPTYTKANLEMVKDWRASWGHNLSFYAVQIAPHFYTNPSTTDLGTMQGFFRVAQSDIMSDPEMGIVSTSDLLINPDERYNIHPTDKKAVGVRLSMWALARDYAQPIQYLGPVFQSYTVEGNKIRIAFKPESLGSGLTTKDGLRPTNFRIAGADQKFYPALSTIEGNTVVLTSSLVISPIAIRYAFSDGAITNLMNQEGIPALQFKTDSWPLWPYKAFIDSPDPNTITVVEKNNSEMTKIFPNPFSNCINISGFNQNIHHVDLFDILGRKIKTQMGAESMEMTLDVSDLAKGVYMLRIMRNDMTSIDIKTVKQ